MPNNIEFNAGRFINKSIFDNANLPLFNMTFNDQTFYPAISNVSASLVSNGTGCGFSLGTTYNVTWTPNAAVVDIAHNVKVYIAGGSATRNATTTIPKSVPNVNVTSDEQNTGTGGPVSYTISWELIETAGSTVLQSGAISGTFDIITTCPV